MTKQSELDKLKQELKEKDIEVTRDELFDDVIHISGNAMKKCSPEEQKIYGVKYKKSEFPTKLTIYKERIQDISMDIYILTGGVSMYTIRSEYFSCELAAINKGVEIILMNSEVEDD